MIETKRKPSGRPRGKNIGARLKKRNLGMVIVDVFTPNVSTFKTVQIRLGGWVKPFPEASQQDYDLVMKLTKFRLKRMIRNWSGSYGFYQPESIIDIDTSNVTPRSKDKPRQYFKVDIVLFVRPELDYDKYFVTITTQDLVERAVVVLDEFPEYWSFTHNKNYEKGNG